VRLVVILIVDEETPHCVREEGPQPEKKACRRAATTRGCAPGDGRGCPPASRRV
jgi:hypothetical protein